jgi:hypothetical protein
MTTWLKKNPYLKRERYETKEIDNSGDSGNGGGRRLKIDVAWKKIYYHSSTLPFLQRRRTTDNKKLKKHDKIINQGFNDVCFNFVFFVFFNVFLFNIMFLFLCLLFNLSDDISHHVIGSSWSHSVTRQCSVSEIDILNHF